MSGRCASACLSTCRRACSASPSPCSRAPPGHPRTVRHLPQVIRESALRTGALDIGLLHGRPSGDDLDRLLVLDEPMGVVIAAVLRNHGLAAWPAACQRRDIGHFVAAFDVPERVGTWPEAAGTATQRDPRPNLRHGRRHPARDQRTRGTGRVPDPLRDSPRRPRQPRHPGPRQRRVRTRRPEPPNARRHPSKPRRAAPNLVATRTGGREITPT